MALRAAHGDARIERAAATDLDRIAGANLRRRFADDAMVEPLSFLGKPAEHLRSAVDRDAFFVAGDEKADRTVRLASCEKSLRGGDKGRDRRLHVGCAAAKKRSVVDHCGERIVTP